VPNRGGPELFLGAHPGTDRAAFDARAVVSALLRSAVNP